MPTCDIYRGGSILASGVAIDRLTDGIREGNRVVAQRWNRGWPPPLVTPEYGFPFWDYLLDLDYMQDIRDGCYRLEGANSIYVGEGADQVHVGSTILNVQWVEITRFDDSEWRQKSVYLRLISGPKLEEYPGPDSTSELMEYERLGALNDLGGEKGEPQTADGDFYTGDFMTSLIGTSEFGGI